MASGKRETLGTDVVPTNYEIIYEASLKTFNFSAKENITLQINRPTNTIALNSENLTITSARISSGGKSHKAKVRHNGEKETTEFIIEKAISGKAELHIDFSGEIKENASRGFYRSKYKNKGTEGYIITTQFEPSDARCAFPCFDEPALKATFELTFIVDKSLKVVSNTPIKSESTAGPGKKRIVFHTSPKMSTYLVYFGIGPFEFAIGKPSKPMIRVVTTPGKSDQTEMALGFAKRFLKFYEDYFYIKYPLPKLDLISIPDFTAGASAMENWGAITFRQAELLGKEDQISFTMKRRISTVVSHEIAHQWFGDLVTMKWWDDLWLNESFATFMEKKTLDELYPEFKRSIEALTGETGMAFGDDSLLSTHPINVTVNNPSEVGAIFDLISYYKGSAVLAMIEDYATAETFRMGLHRYFKKHLYSNATKDDLWNAMREVSHGKMKDLPMVSRFWINEAGHPIVSVKRTGDSVTLTQSRFTLLPFKGRQKPWPIPIRYFDGKKEGFILMKGKKATIKVTGPFVKLNFKQKGFYRVAYDKDTLDALGRAIKEKKLGDVDTYGVISDLATIAKACKIKISDTISFLEKYCMGCGYPSNNAIASYLTAVQLRFHANKKLSVKSRALAMKMNKSILAKVGWAPKKNESSMITMQRSSAIRSSGVCGDEDVISKCRKLFELNLSKRSPLNVEIKTAVYLSLAFNGGSSLFDQFVKMYKIQDGGEETMRLGAAIGTFNDAKLAAKALEFSMSKHVRTQDKNSISAYVSSTPNGKMVFLRWIKQNWKTIKQLYKGDVSGLGRFIEDLDDIDTRKEMEDVKKFFYAKENYTPDIEKALKNTLEAIETNIRFVDYNS